jgi:hypothetical protein
MPVPEIIYSNTCYLEKKVPEKTMKKTGSSGYGEALSLQLLAALQNKMRHNVVLVRLHVVNLYGTKTTIIFPGVTRN